MRDPSTREFELPYRKLVVECARCSHSNLAAGPSSISLPAMGFRDRPLGDSDDLLTVAI